MGTNASIMNVIPSRCKSFSVLFLLSLTLWLMLKKCLLQRAVLYGRRNLQKGRLILNDSSHTIQRCKRFICSGTCTDYYHIEIMHQLMEPSSFLMSLQKTLVLDHLSKPVSVFTCTWESRLCAVRTIYTEKSINIPLYVMIQLQRDKNDPNKHHNFV